MVNSVHHYVEKGEEAHVKHWLGLCNDIDEVDGTGRTPLFVAVEASNNILAALILKGSPNPNLPDRQQRYPIHLAIQSNNFKMVELLLTAKADPDKRTAEGENALSLLCAQPGWDPSKAKTAELLLSRGCKVAFVTSQGNTCLHIASHQGLPKMMLILLTSGADADAINQ